MTECFFFFGFFFFGFHLNDFTHCNEKDFFCWRHFYGANDTDTSNGFEKTHNLMGGYAKSTGV